MKPMHTPESPPTTTSLLPTRSDSPSSPRICIGKTNPGHLLTGHGSGSSPSQTSSPDDVRYPAYILVPYLLWMDSTGMGTDIYLLPMKKGEERRDDGEKMREEEMRGRGRGRRDKRKQTTIRPPQSFFFSFFLNDMPEEEEENEG